MNYLNEVADAIRSEIPSALLPKENADTLFRLYAVLALAKGTRVTAEDVHNAWSAWMSDTDPSHRSIKPFRTLSADVQCEDQPFVEAIRRVASQMQRHVPGQ